MKGQARKITVRRVHTYNLNVLLSETMLKTFNTSSAAWHPARVLVQIDQLTAVGQQTAAASCQLQGTSYQAMNRCNPMNLISTCAKGMPAHAMRFCSRH
jgi:hypothetical protein